MDVNVLKSINEVPPIVKQSPIKIKKRGKTAKGIRKKPFKIIQVLYLFSLNIIYQFCFDNWTLDVYKRVR